MLRNRAHVTVGLAVSGSLTNSLGEPLHHLPTSVPYNYTPYKRSLPITLSTMRQPYDSHSMHVQLSQGHTQRQHLRAYTGRLFIDKYSHETNHFASPTQSSHLSKLSTPAPQLDDSHSLWSNCPPIALHDPNQENARLREDI